MFPDIQRILIILLILIFCAPAGTTPAKSPPRKEITFIPQWVPQAQFAGYYVAHEKGFYKKYGLDLKIIDGGPDCPSDQYLKEGKADFATLWLSTAIPLRAKGVPVVNIAQTMQRSALMLIAKKRSGIRTPRDMEDRKVGLWGPIFQIQPRAFFRKYGVKVRIVRQSYSVNLFLRDGVDVASAMWYNEYHTILNTGMNPDELVTFFFHEYGLNFPEDGIYTLEKTIKKDPETCRAFVRASLKGWAYAFAHPEETLNIVMRNLKKAHIPATRVHQRWMLNRMRDLMMPKGMEKSLGRLNEKDYERVVSGLAENGFIKQRPSYHSFRFECLGHAEK